jgi:hypothetical protein
LPIANLYRRIGVGALRITEIAMLSVLILATRCANYQDVFGAGNIYFTDADCYARMTRVQMCAEHPGLVVRHHEFENYPAGTTPHTTALFDYFILGLSLPLRPFTAHALDLAGAFISPLLALIGGWFLWWWGKRMRFRYRWAMLILYSISPILVHGTELGRPDHQSALVLLTTIALCAEWVLQNKRSMNLADDTPAARDLRRWAIVSGVAWGLAIWVSAYEPLLLLLLLLLLGLLPDRHFIFARQQRVRWFCFAAIIVIALLIERRLPSLSILAPGEIFRNWSKTIGELQSVSPLNPVWFRWAGYMIVVTPILVWLGIRQSTRLRQATARQGTTGPPLVIVVVMAVTYVLTIWQARWGYFFMSIFVMALPALLEPIKSRGAVWFALALSIFPILREWDENIWPNESELARRIEFRNEATQLRDLSTNLKSSEVRPFLAPWWLSPAIAYWSGQPGVAGSSHESLDGIADSARFFLTDDVRKAREIVEKRRVSWVLAYDADRTAETSALILGERVPEHALCSVLSRAPAQAPRFLIFSAQNGAGRLFRVAPVGNNR